jgi:hypothetical protein
MTVKELQKKLAAIPANNPINVARRRQIIAMINKLVNG